MSLDEALSRHGPVRWSRLWAACASRARRWPVPPHWDRASWWAEAQAEGLAAAWEAVVAYEPAGDPPWLEYLEHRVQRRVWTWYRREFSLDRHVYIGSEAAWTSHPDGVGSDPLAALALHEAWERLSDADRHLARLLFWEGRTEAEIAKKLGVSQQTVSWRKRRLVCAFRRHLSDGDAATGKNCW